jgi:lysozyme family protein
VGALLGVEQLEHQFAGLDAPAFAFQTALNQLSRGGADFPMVAVDGQIGPQTLTAYRALERKRGRIKACELVLKLLDAQQGTHYMGLNKPTFIVGWTDNRLGNVPPARCADSVAPS